MPLEADETWPRRQWWIVLLPLWIVSLVCVWSILDELWIPHDEGTLAQAAERVAYGELPHRDFDEVYTGGLDWLNAGAFRVFGTSLRSMRIALFIVFALWIPAVFWIATRFVRPLLAAPFVGICVAWSLPTYCAPMPSWYVLFCATFGAAALLRHTGGGGRFWLVAAGFCGGLAALAKITGVHFAVAAFLFFAWREPALTAGIPEQKRSSRLYPAALTLVLAALIGALFVQVLPLARRFGFFGEIEQFVLPEAIVALLAARRVWTGSRAPAAARLETLLGLVLPFAAGFALPIIAFLVPYLVHGGLDRLIEGVLILPARRLHLMTAVAEAPAAWTAVYLLPFIAVALIPPPRGRRWPKVLLGTTALAMACALSVSLKTSDVYLKTWIGRRSFEVFWATHFALRHALPALALVGAWRLWRSREWTVAADRVVLMLSVAALLSLVQFPFSVPIYFYYFAPLLVLLGLAMLSSTPSWVRERPGVALIVAYLLVLSIVSPMRIGRQAHPITTGTLATERSGLALELGHVNEWNKVLALVKAHAKNEYVWAGPDAPEIAFLAGLRNPTRTIFDCFDADFGADPKARAERLIRDLDRKDVKVVAYHVFPSFSGTPPPEILEALRVRFPNFELTSNFAVGWRE